MIAFIFFFNSSATQFDPTLRLCCFLCYKNPNISKLFKNNLNMQATLDDGLWMVRRRSRQFCLIHSPIPNWNQDTYQETWKKSLIKLYRQNVSLLFNQTCLNERLLPNCTHTHTHTHTHIYIYIYIIYIYIYIYIYIPKMIFIYWHTNY